MREFSLKGYKALLSAFKEAGYTPKAFDESDAFQDQDLLLRHDIDVSLDKALIVAQAEKELGLFATYYILVSNPCYNIFTAKNRQILNAIQDMGHKIALHFDISVYNIDPNEPNGLLDKINDKAKSETRLLEEVIGNPVSSISFHKPAKSLQGLEDDIAGLPHSYQPRFFHDIEYISDSSGHWRYGHPFDNNAFKDKKCIQLLTHPIWWANEAVLDDRNDRLYSVVSAVGGLVDQQLRQDFKSYVDYQPIP